MKKKQIIVLVIGVLVIIALFILFTSRDTQEPQGVLMEEPVDVVVDFYGQWTEEKMATSTDPYTSGLAESNFLSPALKEKIANARDEELDPVLCQTTTDIQIATRRAYVGETEVQILVTARDKSLTGQALYTLRKEGEGWYIDDIRCSAGEFGEDREFTFETEGFLIKGSTLESLDPELWYIIFEQDGRPGLSAPLLFGAESKCAGETCNQDQLTEKSKIFVQGQMTERGVEVVNLEVVEE